MIVFNLNCSDCTSSFEGWFENTKDYNKQIRKGLLTCPSCNSTQIKKGLMAPNLSKKLSSRLISGTAKQAKGKSVAMISNIRDQYLVDIQKLRKKYEKKLR